MEGFACVLTFDTDSVEFARGVEVGRLWEMLKREVGEFTEDIHASNAEMALRMAEVLGRAIRAEDLDEIWLRVTFGPENLDAP